MASSVSGSPFARWLLLAYGLLNALLYSSLLPLWEGFDEPFHFDYIQSLADGRGFPDPRSSLLSGEVGASLLLAPGSDRVKENLPEIRTYEEYFQLPRSLRIAMRQQLPSLHGRNVSGQNQGVRILNYEGLQSPLAYLLLAVPDRILGGLPLPDRVLGKTAAIFCVYSMQMLWATIAHVANDWLAVPLGIWFLVAVIRYWRRPGLRGAASFGCLLAVGLLTKAYFLAFVPLAAVPLVKRRPLREFAAASAIVLGAAGPWYVRNLLHYGSLGGTQESRLGVGVMSVIENAGKLNWPAVIVASVRSSLWTGNNSFTAFSGRTEAVLITAWAVALILWVQDRRDGAESIAIIFSGLFLVALGYGAVVAFVITGGSALGPSPWYAQILLAPMLGLAMLGCARAGRLGNAAAMVLVSLCAYMLAATYLFKLIPYYAGYMGRTSWHSLMAVYSNIGNLSDVALAPAWMPLTLALLVSALAFAQAILLLRAIFARGFPLH